jgi:hypothetical protein
MIVVKLVNELNFVFFKFSFCFCFIEVPCDRIISPLNRNQCSRILFFEPLCEERKYSLIYHIQSQTCICREINNKKSYCFNNGILIIDDNDNSTICS